MSHTTDTDLGAKRITAALSDLSRWWANVGLWSSAVNYYGESIIRYASVQAASKGKAPGWIKRAYSAGMGAAKEASETLYDQILSGRSDLGQLVDEVAVKAAAAWVAVPAGIPLRKTGALLAAVDFSSPDHPHVVSQGGMLTRTKRGFAKMTAAQQLYQLYHKGRSKSLTRMRKQTTFAGFKAAHGKAWAEKTAESRGAVKAEIKMWSRRAAAANVPDVGRQNRSRARLVRDLLAGRPIQNQVVPVRGTFGRSHHRRSST
jgi:hypothetical protein